MPVINSRNKLKKKKLPPWPTFFKYAELGHSFFLGRRQLQSVQRLITHLHNFCSTSSLNLLICEVFVGVPAILTPSKFCLRISRLARSFKFVFLLDFFCFSCHRGLLKLPIITSSPTGIVSSSSRHVIVCGSKREYCYIYSGESLYSYL